MVVPVLGLVALLGLAAGRLLLGGGAGSNGGDPVAQAPDLSLPPVVATVGGLPVTRDEVLTGLGDAPNPTADDLHEVVRSLVENRLLSEAATAMEPSGKARLAPELVLAGQALVDPVEVEELWNRNRRIFWGDVQSIRHVSARTDGEAGRLRTSLLAPVEQSGAPTLLPPVDQVGPGALAPEIEQILSSLQPGETSQPIQADGRYHVVQLVQRKPAVEVGFSDWQVRLTDAVRAQRWHRERPRWLKLREVCSAVTGDPRFTGPSLAEVQDYFLTHPSAVAVVNGRDITRDELLSRVRQVRSMGKDGGRHHHDHEPSESELRAALLKMIESTVILQEAERQGVTLDEREIDERYRTLRSGFASDAELEGMLRENATSPEEWRRSMRNGLLLLKTEMTAARQLPVGEEEIESYWKENRESFARDRLLGTRVDFETEQAARDARVRMDGRPSEPEGPPPRWLTADQLPREVWTEAWTAVPGMAIGPVRTAGGYVVMRVTARQEADGQTAEDHRDAITGILQRSRWAERERTRWVLSLMERSTIWNRFDLTMKLGEPVPADAGTRGQPALVVVARSNTCEAGFCDTVVSHGRSGVPLRVVTGPRADRLAREWGLHTLPWVFAVEGGGRVVGECPGPVTEGILTQLTTRLSLAPRTDVGGPRPARRGGGGYARG